MPTLAQAWFITAMAHTRLGQQKEACVAMTRGEALLNQPHVDFVQEYAGGWGQWTFADLLHAQAAEMIAKQSPATRP